MATGPEHYREAERLLEAVDDLDATDPKQQRIIAWITAEAQVHATLALAAATALTRFADMPVGDCDAWLKAASEEPTRSPHDDDDDDCGLKGDDWYRAHGYLPGSKDPAQ